MHLGSDRDSPRADRSARLTVVPAIDLRAGRCVRLVQGDPRRELAYDDDPVTRALSFAHAGAALLHVVDLDGAFGTGENLRAIGEIVRAVDIPVQTGGGIRTPADVDARFAAGAAFAILGTMLVEEPDLSRAVVERYGARIIGGVDARGDRVAVRGWAADAPRDRDSFVREVFAMGIERIVFTEIARDGTGDGFDLAALSHVAALAPLAIAASGGARTIGDLRGLAAAGIANVDQAIVGRALYDGTIDLAEAIAALA